MGLSFVYTNMFESQHMLNKAICVLSIGKRIIPEDDRNITLSLVHSLFHIDCKQESTQQQHCIKKYGDAEYLLPKSLLIIIAYKMCEDVL